MNTLTKDYLAGIIESRCHTLQGKDAMNAVTDLVNIVQASIFKREVIYIPKVCRISVSLKSERIGRNPKTLEPAVISARHAVTTGIIGNIVQSGKLIKSALISRLIDVEYSCKQATEITEAFYFMVEKVQSGDFRIEIRGLGVFYPRIYKSGTKRNPRTGESIQAEERVIVAFKCSPSLRKALDREYLY